MRDFHKPINLQTYVFDQIAGGVDPVLLAEIISDSAWGLLSHARGTGRTDIAERIIAHATDNGIDDVAELWGSAGSHTLAGVLWRLYMIRKAVQDNPELLAVVYRAGAISHTANPVIAGARTPITPEAISDLIDEIFRGVFAGDFSIALARACAYCRVMSEGATAEANAADLLDSKRATTLTKMAARYLQLAQELEKAAQKWQTGTLE